MSRTIVITGGTSGIGLALKENFEKNGDKVITFSLDESSEQNHYQGSVDHEIKVNQVFNDIYEKHGNIDMLINCAGFGMSAITEIAPMEKINSVMDVNFYGTLYCSRAALRYMREGSRIVNMSSAMALFPVPFKSIYGAAKSAVLSLSFAMRMELAPVGIDVVAFCPGDTKTNFTKNRIKEFETTERYGDRLKNSTTHHESKENKRMSVDFVAGQIYKLANKKKTKPFYIVGGKYKLIYFLTRLTPKSLLINITGKKLGGVGKTASKNTKVADNYVDSTVLPQEETPVSPTMQEATMFTALNNNLATAEESPVEVTGVEGIETETVAIAEVQSVEEQPSNNVVLDENEPEEVGEEQLNELAEETNFASVEESQEEVVPVVFEDEEENVAVENRAVTAEEPVGERGDTDESVEEKVVEQEVVTPVVFDEGESTNDDAEEAVNRFATFNAVVEEQNNMLETEEVSAEVSGGREEALSTVDSKEDQLETVQTAENVAGEETVPNPAEKPRTFGSFDALRQSISNIQRPSSPVGEPEATPVVVEDDTTKTEGVITPETSVFASVENVVDETTVSNNQIDDDRLN